MAFINPFQKCRCPSCSAEFYLNECAIISANSGNVLEPPLQGNARRIGRFWLKSLDGPEYVEKLASRQCLYCQKALPYNVELVDNITIAVVGDTFSGKSNYITAAIHQMKSGYMQQADGYSRFIRLTPDVEERYIQNFFNPLFNQKQVLPGNQSATTPINEPLIYEFVFQKSSSGQVKRVNLLIYDVSGEDIANQTKMVQVAKYILYANAIIFLADPMTMPGIVDQLPFHLRSTVGSTRRASDVLNWTIQTFERAKRLSPGARLPIPVSVTLSKSDLLRYIRWPSGSQPRFLYQPTYNGTIDQEDLRIVDDEVRSLIQGIGDPTIIQAVSRFNNVSFSATSATGWPPDAQGTYPQITPIRCLDPILWILWRLRIID